MSNQNRFVIENSTPKPLTLYIEPEGAAFSLGTGEEVSVMDTFEREPVTLRVSASDTGSTIISVWPGDGEMRVEKGGVNVFDLM